MMDSLPHHIYLVDLSWVIWEFVTKNNTLSHMMCLKIHWPQILQEFIGFDT